MPPSAGHQPVAAAVGGGGHAHDGLVQRDAAHRAVEGGVTEGEHAAVQGHQPVAPSVGGGGHAHDRSLEDQGAERAVEPGGPGGEDAAVGRGQPVAPGRRRRRVGRHGHHHRGQRARRRRVEGRGVAEGDDPATAVDMGRGSARWDGGRRPMSAQEAPGRQGHDDGHRQGRRTRWPRGPARGSVRSRSHPPQQVRRPAPPNGGRAPDTCSATFGDPLYRRAASGLRSGHHRAGSVAWARGPSRASGGAGVNATGVSLNPPAGDPMRE